jgi:hypothetical protein
VWWHKGVARRQEGVILTGGGGVAVDFGEGGQLGVGLAAR